MNDFVEPQFFIKSGDMGFSNRQKSIFDMLKIVEKEKNERQQKETMDSENISVSPNVEVMDVSSDQLRPKRRLRSETKQFRGKESIFKRPEVPPPRSKQRNIPDYQRNPHRWTKYSLGDVSQEDMSERSNTTAALNFLREIEARKLSEPMDNDFATQVITFKPKNTFKKEDVLPEEKVKSSFRSSKLIMPEYVVGQEKKKLNKRCKTTSAKSDNPVKNIKLLHLMEDEEDE